MGGLYRFWEVYLCHQVPFNPLIVQPPPRAPERIQLVLPLPPLSLSISLPLPSRPSPFHHRPYFKPPRHRTPNTENRIPHFFFAFQTAVNQKKQTKTISLLFPSHSLHFNRILILQHDEGRQPPPPSPPPLSGVSPGRGTVRLLHRRRG